ncbi:MAG: GAF domain-containing protein [Chloroflexi bacterium]|nr:GAF domain-containing protein [Chloroflexota bacterium]
MSVPWQAVGAGAATVDAVLEINRRLRVALDEVVERERTISRQAEQLRLLNGLARAVGSTLKMRSLCTLIVQQVAELMGAARCAVLQYDPVADRFTYAALWHNGNDETPPPHTTITTADHGSSAARCTRAPFLVNDTRNLASDPLQRRADEGILSQGIVPIIAGDDVWGTINVGFDEMGQVTPDRIEFLTAITSHLAIAIFNAQLYSDLRAAHQALQEMQEQVVQQERLRALGTMASRIAHDLNNALAPIVGFSELLLHVPGALEDREKARTYLELIHTGAHDAASVVHRLRGFYRYRDSQEAISSVAGREPDEQVSASTTPVGPAAPARPAAPSKWEQESEGPPATPPQRGPARPPVSLHVLAIDDEPSLRAVVESFLGTDGHVVTAWPMARKRSSGSGRAILTW